MLKLFLKILYYFIDKAQRNEFIRSFYDTPIKIEKFEKFSEFKDSSGNVFELRKGLRSKIKPGWENMFKKNTLNYSSDYIDRIVFSGKYSVNRIEPILHTFGKKIEGSNILEIGCHAGAAAFCFAQKGAKEVVASEFTEYKVESVDNKGVTEGKLANVSDELTALRNKLGKKYERRDRVRFVEDDICNSVLPKNHFDIISSWEVFEHLHNPKKALESISTLLKEDGIAIHDYNPFFCLGGGHSLCTLDFLWGHVRLNEQDFNRYIEQIRPHEKEKALAFYYKGVNRMTIENLKQFCAESNLTILSLLFSHNKQHIKTLNQEIYNQSKRNYPTLSYTDLVTPIITLIVKKSSTPNLIF